MKLSFKVSLLSASILLSVNAFASERVEIPSSFNPVGSGARALGLGGSFIAMADDATAASWNPGALTQLRTTELALAYSSTSLSEDNSFSLDSQLSGEQIVDSNDINYLAFSVPCGADACGKNMVFSVNYQRLYDLSRKWSLQRDLDDTDFYSERKQALHYKQSGSLAALGLAYAVQLSDELSVGITLNLWSDGGLNDNWDISFSEQIVGLEDDVYPFSLTTKNKFINEFEGRNFNLGALWQLFQEDETKLTLGFVYKSGFTADITQTASFTSGVTYPTDSDFDFESEGTMTSNQKLEMPQSIGLGLAYQFSDNFTASVDVYQTSWSDFVLTDSDGIKRSPLSNKPIEEHSIDDTVQIRIGSEYRIISQEFGAQYIIPIRAGAFIDPAAAEGGADDTYGFSIGTGIAYEHFVFDIAYQYRFGNDIGKSVMPKLGYSQDIEEQQVIGSVFYRF
jgi:long-subunit fatty acid transport protein